MLWNQLARSSHKVPRSLAKSDHGSKAILSAIKSRFMDLSPGVKLFAKLTICRIHGAVFATRYIFSPIGCLAFSETVICP